MRYAELESYVLHPTQALFDYGGEALRARMPEKSDQEISLLLDGM